MASGMAAAVLPVSLVLVGLVVLLWRMLPERDRGQTPSAGGEPGLLLGLLVLAAFALGAFLTYALLGLR